MGEGEEPRRFKYRYVYDDYISGGGSYCDFEASSDEEADEIFWRRRKEALDSGKAFYRVAMIEKSTIDQEGDERSDEGDGGGSDRRRDERGDSLPYEVMAERSDGKRPPIGNGHLRSGSENQSARLGGIRERVKHLLLYRVFGKKD